MLVISIQLARSYFLRKTKAPHIATSTILLETPLTILALSLIKRYNKKLYKISRKEEKSERCASSGISFQTGKKFRKLVKLKK